MDKKGHPAPTPTTSNSEGKKQVRISSNKKNERGSSGVNRKPTVEQIARAKEKRELVLKQVRKEKRIMLCSSVLAALCAIVWVIAVAADRWYLVEGGPFNGTINEEVEDGVQNGKVFVKSVTGLWRSCRTVKSFNFTHPPHEEWCNYHTLFPNREEIKRNPSLDEHVIDYRRTAICFGIISLLMMLMSLIAAFYTFKNGRYMYKRLASGLYFITSVCILVVLEVVVTCVRYEQLNVPFNHPPLSETSYGISFGLGWLIFVIYLLNGCLFLVYSRKRKGDHNQIMGR